MTNMTLALPEDLHAIMRKHKTIKWSEVARTALWEEARRVNMFNALLRKSTLTEKDAERIGRSMKRGIARKHGLK